MTPDIVADEIAIDPSVSFGRGVRLRGQRIEIGAHTRLERGVDILCPAGFTLGVSSYIGPDTRIACWRLHAGAYAYIEDGVRVGWGGAFDGPDSEAILGTAVFVGFGSVLNTARRLTIGDEVGIGARVGIWTHGAYLPVDRGFPCTFAPVTIGSRVWITGGSQILPGVTVGDNVVVGMGSIVHRDIPSGALAAGNPARVVQHDRFPDDSTTQDQAIAALVTAWRRRCSFFGMTPQSICRHTPGLVYSVDGARFDFATRGVRGSLSPLAEDFRDFCRRHGIRFVTGAPFRPLRHPLLERFAPVAP